MVKNRPAMLETWIRSLVQEDPWRKDWHPTPVFLPGESHKQRSLAVYRPWGHKESDTAERLSPSWIQHLFESDEPHHEHFENEMKPSDVN